MDTKESAPEADCILPPDDIRIGATRVRHRRVKKKGPYAYYYYLMDEGSRCLDAGQTTARLVEAILRQRRSSVVDDEAEAFLGERGGWSVSAHC